MPAPAAPLLLAAALSAAAPPASPTVPPERDDANLHALHLAGDSVVACGDQGTVWTSADAGRSWTYRPAPTTLHLRSLSFLTGSLGWAAGGGTEAFTAASEGVVLKTTDGGASWRRVDRTPLPAVVAVRFFTPDRGLAACVPTDAAPSGLWETTDGGATWVVRPGVRLGHWRAAALPSPRRAVLVGERGRVAYTKGSDLAASPAAPGGLAGAERRRPHPRRRRLDRRRGERPLADRHRRPRVGTREGPARGPARRRGLAGASGRRGTLSPSAARPAGPSSPASPAPAA